MLQGWCLPFRQRSRKEGCEGRKGRASDWQSRRGRELQVKSKVVVDSLEQDGKTAEGLDMIWFTAAWAHVLQKSAAAASALCCRCSSTGADVGTDVEPTPHSFTRAQKQAASRARSGSSPGRRSAPPCTVIKNACACYPWIHPANWPLTGQRMAPLPGAATISANRHLLPDCDPASSRILSRSSTSPDETRPSRRHRGSRIATASRGARHAVHRGRGRLHKTRSSACRTQAKTQRPACDARAGNSTPLSLPRPPRPN